MPYVLIEPNQRPVRESPPPGYPSASIGEPDTATDDSIGTAPTSPGFAALLAVYRASGGTARGDDVARLLEDHRLGDFVGLTRLIASRELFGFEWRDSLWIPMFQFDLRDLSIKRATRSVLMELGTGSDGWAKAAWFARTNPCLGGRRPVDLMEIDLSEVLGAARVNRFMAQA